MKSYEVVKYHLIEALQAALAETDGKEVLAQRLHAETKLRLINMSDEELWELAKITASPPEEPVDVVYQGHKKAVEELKTTATEWMKDLPLKQAQPMPKPLVDRFFVWLARHIGVGPQPLEAPAVSKPKAVRREEETAEVVTDSALLVWVPALLFYGFGDVLTSALAFAVGAEEANPLARVLVGLPGGIWIFALAKTAILVLLLFISHYKLGRYYWIISAILTILGGYLVGKNLLVFFQAT